MVIHEIEVWRELLDEISEIIEDDAREVASVGVALAAAMAAYEGAIEALLERPELSGRWVQ